MQQLQQTSLRRSLALVVGCTNGKSLPVPTGLRVADLVSDDGRPATWRQRLAEAQARVPLRSLYSGSQWTASLNLEIRADALGHEVELWVVSAGLGLVPASTAAPAYAASFSSGPDVVATSLAERRAWWGALRDRTSSFLELAERCDQMLVVLAPSYLEVISPDLSSLDSRALAVVSSGRGDFIYSSTGLRQALRASAMTLNTVAAAQLLNLAGDAALGSDEVRARWGEWVSDHARQEVRIRQAASDEEVVTFIRSSLAEAKASRSRLLTRLRAEGRACEQSRFQRLYNDVTGSGT